MDSYPLWIAVRLAISTKASKNRRRTTQKVKGTNHIFIIKIIICILYKSMGDYYEKNNELFPIGYNTWYLYSVLYQY